MAMPLFKVSYNTKVWIRRSRWVPIALLVVSGTLLFVVTPMRANYQIKQLNNELSEMYGLVVRYEDPARFYSPPLEAVDVAKDSSMALEKAEKAYVPEALTGVRDALKRYPSELVRRYLSAVFVVGKIKISNVDGAATFSNSSIYLAAPRWDGLGTLSYELSVHHEFSTLLFYGAKFPVIDWHLVNPPDFKYLEKYEEIIRAADPKNRKRPGAAAQWYEAGFVSDYGMSSMANDFGTYAEMALGEPEKLKQLTNQYFLIKRKKDILIKFYTELAPQMCDYFKKVGLTDDCSLASK